MAPIDDVVRRFLPFSQDDNAGIDWTAVPVTMQNPQPGDVNPVAYDINLVNKNQVNATIVGQEYFEMLLEEMDRLLASPDGGFFWMHGWYFQLFEHESLITFYLDETMPANLKGVEDVKSWQVYHKDAALRFASNAVLFVDKLTELHGAGVDVRIIGWLPPIFFKLSKVAKAAHGFAPVGKQLNDKTIPIPYHLFDRNVATFYSLIRLRQDLGPGRTMFDTVTHPLGGAHSKMVIAGNNAYLCAFTGGIDAAPSRNQVTWSDAAIRVEGYAASDAATFYKQLWNEIVTTPPVTIRASAVNFPDGGHTEIPESNHVSHLGNTIDRVIADKGFLYPQQPSDYYVQMFRTLPRKNYTLDMGYMESMAFSIVNNVGGLKLFGLTRPRLKPFLEEVRKLKYVYSDPISFAPNGRFEFKTVCFKAISQATSYIFIMDQYLYNEELLQWINHRILTLKRTGNILRVVLATKYLYDVYNEDHTERVTKLGKRQAETLKVISKGIPRNQWANHFLWVDMTTHAKLILIDDIYVSIGSANFARRSFYTDIEMGMAIMHEDQIIDFRRSLFRWFLNGTPQTPENLQDALGIWFRSARRPLTTVDYTQFNIRFPNGFPEGYDKIKDEEEVTNRFNNPDSNLGY
jgi:phosphatidylserine/phosphatidylglycerophosphate/cardiolipin synthase-like enzyme